MADVNGQDRRFGEIAVNLGLIHREKLDRALVVQKMIFSRTKVHMPIGKVLKEMGAITQEQIETVLDTQKSQESTPSENGRCDLPEVAPNGEETVRGISLSLSQDRLRATLCPSEEAPRGLTLAAVKCYLADRKVVFGLVEDDVLSQYLMQDPLPREPFVVAQGIPPLPGRPPEVIYHFDTDPMRIGTLTADGTMDWKNRGEIPQVAVGDLLVEKTMGDPGAPGTGVCGGEIPPARIREPQIKCGKGVERSEDGRRIVAKISGTPKLGSDGKVFVFGMLPIDGDIGVETGHIDFDGHIEASGGVTSGYSVKARGLRTAGIQDADIEIDEDLNCLGGMYGSTINVGGNLKAGHVHNCTINVLGDLVVEKEIYDSTIETNGRCLIGEGKIIASRIDAKKGVYAGTVGSDASSPCSLTVGIDRKYQKDMALYEEELGDLKRQKKDVGQSALAIREGLESAVKQLGILAQEQDSFMVQKRQFEQQLRGEGPNPVEDDEEREMLEEMIGELVEKNESMETQIASLMKKEDRLGAQLSGFKKSLAALDAHIDKTQEKISLLDTALKVDPGIPVVKVSGIIFAKTHITARHKEITLPETLRNVRIAESLSESVGHKYQIQISNQR